MPGENTFVSGVWKSDEDSAVIMTPVEAAEEAQLVVEQGTDFNGVSYEQVLLVRGKLAVSNECLLISASGGLLRNELS
jgi:hypothetical protein